MSTENPPQQKQWWLRTRPWAMGALIGLAYTVPARLIFFGLGWPKEGDQSLAFWLVGAMSTAFLFGVPAATGALAVEAAARKSPVTLTQAILLPWVACATAIAVAAITLIEGSICIFLAAPVFFGMGSVGGVAMWLLQRARRKPGAPVALSVALLPLLWGGAEANVRGQPSLYRVDNVQEIAAPPAVVWRHIASVDPIAPEELPWSLSHAIGLPRPIAATLTDQRHGGVRRATFERGLVFREEVTDWQEQKTLAFSIAAEQAPAEALDEHVVVGGQYFDVIDGRYTLRALPNGHTELSLTSTHRLTTTLNGYAGIWSQAIMWDLQRVIMRVVAARCEAAVAAKPPQAGQPR